MFPTSKADWIRGANCQGQLGASGGGGALCPVKKMACRKKLVDRGCDSSSVRLNSNGTGPGKVKIVALA